MSSSFCIKKEIILLLIYSNLGRNLIEKKSTTNKIKQEIIKKIIFIPDIKIKTDQLKKNQ